MQGQGKGLLDVALVLYRHPSGLPGLDPLRA
jgi:hypothetical protein